MAVPKRHRSKSRQGQRRMHVNAPLVNTGKCAKCGAVKFSHTVCPSCGFYRGREVVNVLAVLDKKKKKAQKEGKSSPEPKAKE